MKKSLRTILILLLVLAVLGAGFWYFFLYRSGLPASLYTAYADFCDRSGRTASAAKFYTKALDLTPEDAALALKTADAYARSDNDTKAEYTLVRAISHSPDNLELYLGLSALYVDQDKLLDAERLISACASETVRETLNGLRPSAPVIQPDGGYSLEPNEFSLSYQGGIAYYSMTEEYPTLQSEPYGDPVSLSYGVTTVSAIVVADNGLVSPLSTAEFTVCGEIAPVTFQDEAFDAFIRTQLGKDKYAEILTSDLWTMEALTIPPELTNLTDLSLFPTLQSLTLQSSTADLSPLSSLQALRTLDLSGCTLTDANLTAIGAMTTLEELRLSACGITAPDALSGLQSLQILDLSQNAITDLTALSAMPKLQELYLSGNQISAITPLAASLQLTVLDLSANPIDSLGALSANETLQTLNIASCAVTDLLPLDNKTALTTLDASGNQLTSLNGLAGCTALSELKLAKNEIADLTPIAALPALQYLDVSENALEALPALSCPLLTLNLSLNQLTDVSALSGLNDMNYLNVSSNRLTDLSALADLPNLVQIDAYQNPLIGVDSLTAHSIVVNYDEGYTLPVEETAAPTAEE